MTILIEICCDNAAFENEPGREIARILCRLAYDFGRWDGAVYPEVPQLRDINGNAVGKVTWRTET